MANTNDITVYQDVWTLVSVALNGTIENQTGERIKVNFAAALPTPSVTTGHMLDVSESAQWAIDSGSVYVRITDTTIASGTVVIST